MENEKIHIAMVGRDLENVVNGILSLGATELYPIVSDQFQDTAFIELRNRLSPVTIHDSFRGTPLVIDPFKEDSFLRMIEMIIDIVQNHPNKKCEFWVNITGGTNLMSAAAEAGAVLTRSKAYYVVKGMGTKKQDIIKLPWHSLNPREMDAYYIRILASLNKTEERTNKDLASELGLTHRAISHRLKELAKAEYITQVKEGREVFNEITAWGKVALLLCD